MYERELNDMLTLLENSLSLQEGKAVVQDEARLRATIHRLAEVSALESGVRQGLAQYVVRLTALALGIVPASIHTLYLARGRGDMPCNYTVPAINLRALSFYAARAVFRSAICLDAGPFIFEIARSEIGYTAQRPAEYATSILAAAIAEGYHGPVFLQGDHFQISAKKYASNPTAEMQAVSDLVREAISAGFYNIDIDASTLVDLSKATVAEQQALNTQLTAQFSAEIRRLEPAGVTISIGGEIGEVGGHNSTEEELHAFMQGYLSELKRLAADATGISKLSIQTGTSHGGVVLPDGSIAQVDVDFDALTRLGRVARKQYKLGGVVQHGASTLPETAFGKFVDAETCEVHLATNFQNILYDRLPDDLRSEIYAWLDQNQAAERKAGMTDEQFYYKTRKNAIGPFKAKLWQLDPIKRTEILNAWQDQFRKLFVFLGMRGTRRYVEEFIKAVPVQPELSFYLGEAAKADDVKGLAD